MKKVLFDYSALEGKIKQFYDTQDNFAKAIPMARSSLNQNLQNKGDFSTRKILRMCQLLNIKNEEISEYFFKEKSSEIRN